MARLVTYLLLAFACVHALYLALGIRFDASSLGWFWQYLDPVLLRTRLAESLLYLHSQPALFNLFLGLVLKLAPGRELAAFQGLYLVIGLTLYLALFMVQLRLGVSRTIALLLSILFVISPSFILYESWLFYTLPLTTLLTLSALLLHEALDRRRTWLAWCFFVTLLALAGIHSFFHLAFYSFVTIGVVALAGVRERKRFLAAAVLPFLVLFALYAKNLALFGKFTTSTWMGMNVWAMTTRNLPMAEREELVRQGNLSPVSLVERFSELEAYPASYLQVKGYTEIPALRDVRKSTGFPNYNNLATIAISDQYLKDACYVLVHEPKTFLIGNLRSWFSYFRSSGDYVFLEANRSRLAPINTFYDFLFYGKIPFDLSQIRGLPIYTTNGTHYLYLFLLLGLPLLVFFGLSLALRKGKAGFRDRSPMRIGVTPPLHPALSPAQRIVVLYICFNIIYVALAGNLLEAGENNRFRFMTDPFFVTLLGLSLQQGLIRRRH